MHRTAPAPDAPDLTPDSGDHILAAFAYLGYLAGLWLLAPIAVYLLRRKHSRFVAHHAVRALLIHLLMVPLGLALSVLAISLGIGVVASFPVGVGSGPGLTALLMMALAFTSLAPTAILLIITLVAALRAYQGRLDPHTRLGRASESLLRQDPGLSDH